MRLFMQLGAVNTCKFEWLRSAARLKRPNPCHSFAHNHNLPGDASALSAAALLNVSQGPSSQGSKTAKFSLPIWDAPILVSLLPVKVYLSHAQAIEHVFAENGEQKIARIFGP